MKTLYVSDLDGTLLCSNQFTSEYTNSVINRIVDTGIHFTFATARSFYTARKVTKGINARMPLIIYNGTFVLDSLSGELLVSNYLNKVNELVDDLLNNNIYPIVYSYINSAEKFSFLQDSNCGVKEFVKSRKDDLRINPINDKSKLTDGKPFYITCIDDKEKLKPLYEKYRNDYHCVYSTDIYSGTQWLEFMPKNATKANAVKFLKGYLGCDKIVAFGDGINDLEMFKVADECYAVSNAVDELKQIASGIIESNDNNGVAKWLNEKLLRHI